MKNKYERLSRQERKEARLRFRDSGDFGANLYKRLTRLKVVSIIGIVYSIIAFIWDFYREALVWDYVLDAILLVFCVWFLYKSFDLMSSRVNAFLIEESKPFKKKKSKKKEEN